MVIALRALQFCCRSNLLARESLLWKDRREQRRGQDLVVKEGLGIKGHAGEVRCRLVPAQVKLDDQTATSAAQRQHGRWKLADARQVQA